MFYLFIISIILTIYFSVREYMMDEPYSWEGALFILVVGSFLSLGLGLMS